MSTSFRDYVFFPLGGSRGGLGRICINTMITMGLVGLWHGAAWTFVLWGCYHGALLTLSIVKRHVVARLRPDAPSGPEEWSPAGHVLRVAVVFHLTLIAGLIFRSSSLATIGHMWTAIRTHGIGPGVSAEFLLLMLFALLLHFTPEQWKKQIEDTFSGLPAVVQGAIAALVIGLIVTAMSTAQPYYYFQF
jgi:D-alanyl-lipoteichoic acid acyltransferase DltB (MBOAT superfamily)